MTTTLIIVLLVLLLVGLPWYGPGNTPFATIVWILLLVWLFTRVL